MKSRPTCFFFNTIFSSEKPCSLGFLNNDQLIYNQMASFRIQFLPALRAAVELNFLTYAFNLRVASPLLLSNYSLPSFCVVGKLNTFTHDQINVCFSNLQALVNLKKLGIPIIVLYSDNWCEYDPVFDLDSYSEQRIMNIFRAEFYKELLSYSDLLVCPCRAQQEQAVKWINADSSSIVIEDQLQLPCQEFPELDPRLVCRIVWFGHYSNIVFLLDKLTSIITNCQSSKNFELMILSDNRAKHHIIKLFENLKPQTKWTLKFYEWNLINFSRIMTSAHICLLPSDTNCPRKSVSSHNRAADSIHAGCIVIATPLPSYKELSNSMLLGDNFPFLIDHAVLNYYKLVAKFKTNREEILYRFMPDAVSSKWKITFNNLLLR